MEAAAEEAVSRIQGTPFAHEAIIAHRVPKPDEWVFPPELEEKIRRFLANDSLDSRMRNNFIIKPAGTLWKSISSMYGVKIDNISTTALQIGAHMTDPRYCRNQHYSTTIYRMDSNWKGPEDIQRRFEVQPVLDISKLPEMHYMSYEQTCRLLYRVIKL